MTTGTRDKSVLESIIRQHIEGHKDSPMQGARSLMEFIDIYRPAAPAAQETGPGRMEDLLKQVPEGDAYQFVYYPKSRSSDVERFHFEIIRADRLAKPRIIEADDSKCPVEAIKKCLEIIKGA